MKTMMIRKLVLAGPVLATAITAHANLGDTYSECVRQYGYRGKVNGSWIEWKITADDYTLLVSEQFKNNQSVAVRYYGAAGGHFFDSALYQLMEINSRSDQHWDEYNGEATGGVPGRYFATNDHKIYARARFLELEEGTVQVMEIAYRSWIEGNAGFAKPGDRAPVEEGGG